MPRKTTLAARRRSARAAAPAAKTLLKDRAYTELKDLIQSGVFAPDTFLSERQLVEKLGMSKTPIRSALEHLEAQGLVAVSPQQGIVVKDLSAREITDLFDMRAALEPFIAASLASRSWTPPQIAHIKDNLRQQRRAADSEDALAATRLDLEFHLLLAELLDNREMLLWLRRCFDKLHRAILRINRLATGRLKKSYEDHATIAAAILAAESDRAAQAMTAHLDYGRQFLLNG